MVTATTEQIPVSRPEIELDLGRVDPASFLASFLDSFTRLAVYAGYSRSGRIHF